MITREELLAWLEEQPYPLTLEELTEAFKIPRVELPSFDALLVELELQGLVVKTRYGRYGIPKNMNLLVGRLHGHRAGFAFLIPDDPQEDDVFIPAVGLNSAMHGDRVMVRLVFKAQGAKRREGEVIRILERATKRVVGRLERSRRYGFIIPDEDKLGYDFFVAKEDFNGAQDGDKVVAEIIKWPQGRRQPEARVIEVLGRAGDPRVDTISVIRQHGLPEEFPSSVLDEARRVPQEIRVEDYPDFTDLTDMLMVTIDGADARDLDDAVSVEKLANGNYRLGVHIANVGYFVRRGSELDREAYQRGTSVYFPDKVIPMLPRELSNGICSLNPNVNRLAVSCLMEIDSSGTVVQYDILESIIRSKARLTYNEVNRILVDQESELRQHYAHLVPHLEVMAELAQILRRRRRQRGSVDFNFPEAKVEIDRETGQVLGIHRRERTLADSIIEEFMLKANETIAEHFYWLQVPFIYRVHEEPGEESVQELNRFLHNFGLNIKGGENGQVHPKAFQAVLEQVEGRPEENLISTVILRSMRRAIYHPECLGHFGLAAQYYTHFTSPIRRYPDLVIHRIIRTWLRKGSIPPEQLEDLHSFVARAAHRSSERERLADEVEREVADIKKVQFMQDKIGEVFTGLISGVIASGFFVELPNTVEGFVHISSLTDDYYIYEEDKYRLIGKRTGNIYRLGDSVKIQVVRVDVEARRIDFELYQPRSKRRR